MITENNVIIKPIVSKRFFSGNINLVGNQQKNLDLKILTKTQLLDIIEAESVGSLIVSDIDLVKQTYKDLTSTPQFDDSNLKNRISEVETTVGNLTVGVVESKLFWESAEW